MSHSIVAESAAATDSVLPLPLLKRFDVPGPRYTSYPTADRFVEAFNEIGWDHLDQRPPAIEVDGQTYTFEPVAEKRGVQVFAVSPDEDGLIPPREVRRKLDRKVAEYAISCGALVTSGRGPRSR